MAKLFVFIATVCLIQLASGRVARDVSQTQSMPTLTDMFKQAEEIFGQLHTQLLQVVGVSSDRELLHVVETKSRSYASELETNTNQLIEELKKGLATVDENIKPYTDKFLAEVEHFKANNPDIAAHSEVFKQHLENVANNTKDLRERIAADGKEISSETQQLLTRIFDSTVQTAKDVGEQIETAVRNHQSQQ